MCVYDLHIDPTLELNGLLMQVILLCFAIDQP
jgi:hypothetical protein